MNPLRKYYVYVEIEPIDNNKYTYKYDGNGWKPAGTAGARYPGTVSLSLCLFSLI